MNDGVAPVTSESQDASRDAGQHSLPARVLAEGVHAVTGVLQGAVTGAVHGVAQALGAPDTARVDGRSARWTAHRVARREELIDAAMTAIAAHGADVGMDLIAAEAGTSKPVIYRYFNDKTELHRAVSRRIVAAVLDTLVAVTTDEPTPKALIHNSVRAYLELLESNPELFRFVSQNPLVDDALGRPVDFGNVVADLLAQQLSVHLAASGRPPALAHPWAEAIVGFIREASIWWLDHRAVMTRAQLTEYLTDLLWGGAAGMMTGS